MTSGTGRKFFEMFETTCQQTVKQIMICFPFSFAWIIMLFFSLMLNTSTPFSSPASVQPTGFCLRRSRVLLRRWTAGFCFWVAVASSVPLRRLLSSCHAPLVLTAALTGVIPVSFDRRFCSSPLQSTLLPRFRCSMVEGWLKTIDSIGNVSLCLTRSSVKMVLVEHLSFIPVVWSLLLQAFCFNRFDSRWFEFVVSRLELHQRRKILWLVRLWVDLTLKFQAPSILLSLSLRFFERDPVLVCFRWICRLHLRRNRSAGWRSVVTRMVDTCPGHAKC